MTVSGDRPHYLAQSLDSWSAVRGVEDWAFVFAVEPGPHAAECSELIRHRLAACEVDVVLNPVRRGVLGNPHFVLGLGFERSEFVVLAEEDVLASNDVLEFFAYGNAAFSDDADVLAVCASGLDTAPSASPAAWSRVCDFRPLVWATWRDRWEDVLRDTWDLDYTSGPTRDESGWDWNIGRLLESRGMHCVFPDVSRSLHIGKHGVHMLPELFELSQARSYVPHHAARHWIL